MFQRGGAPIGQFGDYQYGSDAAAAQHLFVGTAGVPPLPTVPAPAGAPAVPLGTGITAQLEPLSVAGEEVLVWQEGRWTFAVEYATANAPEALTGAKSEVAYAHVEYLPAPALYGWVVTQVSTTTAAADAVWERHGLAFATAAEGRWNSNLSGGYLSALMMAVSVRPY